MEGELKHFIRFALIFSVVFLLGLTAAETKAQTADYKALIGTWDIELTDVGYQMEFVFKMEDGELTGELIFEMGNGIMENITFENNELSFSVSIDAGGQTVGVDVTATIEGNEMTGNMETDMGGSALTGTKRE